MPCNTIQTSAVFLNMRNVDTDMLRAAIESLNYRMMPTQDGVEVQTLFGYTVAKLDVKTGRFTAYSTRSDNKAERIGSEIAVAFSKQVVAKAASEFGWNLEFSNQEHTKAVVRRKF